MANRVEPMTPPTALRREYAALHCGISPGHFDRLVKEGDLPKPINLSGVKVWLRQQLDEALFAKDNGDEGGVNSCDTAFGM